MVMENSAHYKISKMGQAESRLESQQENGPGWAKKSIAWAWPANQVALTSWAKK